MLAGLMSRWTVRWAWAKARPSQIWAARSTASATGSWGVSPQDVLQALAPDVLHGDDDFAVDLVHADDLDDVGVAQAVQNAGFAEDLNLRQGVSFHNGEPFNADAVKFSFARYVDPAIKNGYATLLKP